MGTDNKKLNNPCHLCKSQNFEIISNKSREGSLLRTVICKDCGLVFSDPFPIEPDNYYKKNYRILYKGVYNPKIKHIHRASQVAIHRYQKIQQHIAPKKNILDIGSGGGEYLYLLSCLGFKTTGIEPNEGYGNYSKQEYQLNIKVGFAQNHAFNQNTFDFISFWHVIEHLDSPAGVLTKVKSWLTDKGLLVVEVPNIEATCQAPKNTFHAAHLYNFNIDTLTLLLNQTGFLVIDQIISSDGGNITLIAKKNLRESKIILNSNLSNNYQRISTILKKHTTLSHFLSHYPYSRPFKKLIKSLKESRVAKKFSKGREVLNHYYLNFKNLNKKL